MMLYRVEYETTRDASLGCSWHSSRREAAAAAAAFRREHRGELARADIAGVQVALTRAGLLECLRRYASHPDNG